MSKITSKVVLFLLGLVVGVVVCKITIAPIPPEFIEVPVEVPVPYEVVKTDTIVKELTKYVYSTDTINTIITEFDTIKITEYVMAYFDTLYYSDTIAVPEFTAIINDTVTQNRITSRKFYYRASPSTEIGPWFVGMDLGYPWSSEVVFGYQDTRRIYKVGLSPESFKAGLYIKF